jgi:hypothetical protein
LLDPPTDDRFVASPLCDDLLGLPFVDHLLASLHHHRDQIIVFFFGPLGALVRVRAMNSGSQGCASWTPAPAHAPRIGKGLQHKPEAPPHTKESMARIASATPHTLSQISRLFIIVAHLIEYPPHAPCPAPL